MLASMRYLKHFIGLTTIFYILTSPATVVKRNRHASSIPCQHNGPRFSANPTVFFKCYLSTEDEDYHRQNKQQHNFQLYKCG